MAEFGIVAGVGRNGVERLLRLIDEGADGRVPPEARECLQALRPEALHWSRGSPSSALAPKPVALRSLGHLPDSQASKRRLGKSAKTRIDVPRNCAVSHAKDAVPCRCSSKI